MTIFKGYGTYNLNSKGDKYVGNFKEDKFSGNGKYIWKNGDVYDGNFARGLMEGTILKEK